MHENSDKAPTISVVMSVYNGEKFLAAAIESILNQSFRNFEFIIVNDGSADGSQKILEEYANRDSRIRLICRENKGLTASLNEGVARASGEWIARMDADDVSLPDRFEKQMAWLKKTGADICGGHIKLTGAWPHRVRRYPSSSEAIRLKLLFGSAFAHPTVVMRASLAKANPYHEKALYVEDYELWTRLSTLGAKMTNYPSVVLRYRIHSGQVTAIRQQQQRENMVQIFQDYAGSFLDKALANDPGYILIADKTLNVDDKGFNQATGFLTKLMSQYGDPEGMVSANAFIFFTRCGKFGLKQLMQATRGFSIGLAQKTILCFLSLMRVEPKSSFYQLLYRVR